MSLQLYLYLLFLLIDTVMCNACSVTDKENNCVYTVVCLTYAGSISVPGCNGQPKVTLRIHESNVTPLRSQFFGATNFDSRVRAIKADGNSWDTIESNTFRYYGLTTEMDLTSNTIRVVNDDAFRDLQVLQKLNISHNHIIGLKPRTLYFGNDPVLTDLDLSDNFISEITDGFSYIPSLENLNLGDNLISSIADDAFTNLKNLKTLTLKRNSLWHLNMTLVNLKKLEVLDLSQNLLLKIAGYEMNRLIALKQLNVSRNQIKTIEDNCFNQAFDLQMLDFSHNQITSDITNLIFINNHLLSYLSLNNNNITRIEDGAFKHNVLVNLNVQNNNITLDITKETFSGLQNIVDIGLQEQNVVAIRNESFSKMKSLTFFNASRNNINIIESDSFTGAFMLNTLDLSHNKINNILFLKNCSANLTQLYINNNLITSLLKDSFRKQTSLMKLDISNNKIVVLEPNSLPLNKLQNLNIAGNNISGVLTRGMFSQAHLLRNLDISNFNLVKLDKEAIADMPAVAKMNISHNAIAYIDSENFINMDNMYSLDLSFNKLTHIILNNTDLDNLKALYLNNNQIINMSLSIINASNIYYLDVSHNNISDVTAMVFKSLPNLKVLNLSHNKIKIFNNQITNQLTKLTDIGLAANALSFVNLSYYPDLISADLSNNSFKYINSSLFHNLVNLQSLDLSLNRISELPPGVFRSVNKLRLVNLSSNNIPQLRFGSLMGLYRTELLDLSRNVISELDIYVFHECYDLTRLILDYNHIKTIDVDKLINITPKLQLISIGGNPLSCVEVVRHVKLANDTWSRQVNITSVEKIYHEDNVYGIRCGDAPSTTTVKAESNVEPDKMNTQIGSTSIVLILCVTIIVMLGILGYFVMRKRQNSNRGRLQLASIVLDESSRHASSDLMSDFQ